MRLKLIFKGNNRYLATEQGDIIENAKVTKTCFVDEIVSINVVSETAKLRHCTVVEIQLDGTPEVIPNYIDSTITEVPQLETKKGDI